MLIYLGGCALAVCAIALALHGQASVLLTTHLVLALAVMPLIFGAIAHFVPVLTRSGTAPRAVRLAPVLLQLAGGLVVAYFAGTAGEGALHAAAGTALTVSAGFCLWLVLRARRALGRPHPGWAWYLAALAVLAGGLALVPAMSYWPASRQALRLLHLHLNTLGFIGLTAIGTLQVLLPTVLSGPDAEASERLRRDLPLALAGVLAVAVGAAGWPPLALPGAAVLAYVAGRLGLSWRRRYGLRTLFGDGASASLTASLGAFLLLLIFGVAHACGVMEGRDAVAAFIAAFLLPLVSGALSQLVPVWLYPGRRTARRDRMRAALVRGGALRSTLFFGAGVALAFGFEQGLWPAAAGLLHFVVSSGRALVVRDRVADNPSRNGS